MSEPTPREDEINDAINTMDWSVKHTIQRRAMMQVLNQFEVWLKSKHLKSFSVENLQEFTNEIKDVMTR